MNDHFCMRLFCRVFNIVVIESPIDDLIVAQYSAASRGQYRDRLGTQPAIDQFDQRPV